ncbi:MAG: hypothetical protein OYG31_00080 [Candidatus Kaiserbacteria bacterium]|nr:hypothetical protein [Candidatus Kaiserbacteria bacterium]
MYLGHRTVRISVAILLLTSLLTGTTFFAAAQTGNPQESVDPAEKVNPPDGLVVDCGFPGSENACTFDRLKEVGVRIMRYLIWFAIFGIVALITWIGFLFATNILRGGDIESEFRKAKGKLLWGILGLILVLGAWLLVEFLFVDVFKYDGGNPLTAIQHDRVWYTDREGSIV